MRQSRRCFSHQHVSLARLVHSLRQITTVRSFSTRGLWCQSLSLSPPLRKLASDNCTSNRWHYARNPLARSGVSRLENSTDFFFQLETLLKSGTASSVTLWEFVKRSYPASQSAAGQHVHQHQKKLLVRVLFKYLNDTNNADAIATQSQLIRLLSFYAAHHLISGKNWVYILEYLAISTYQKTNSNPDQIEQSSVEEQIARATRLRVLFKAWRLFLAGPTDPQGRDHDAGSGDLGHRIFSATGQHHHRSPSIDGGSSGDFADRFLTLTRNPHQIQSTELTHRLTYTAIVSLAGLYNDLRAFYTTSRIAALQRLDRASSDVAECLPGAKQPTWHLGRADDAEWAPLIDLLSVTEALVMHLLAHAAKHGPVNDTFLKIALMQFLNAQNDVQAITKIFQGFQQSVDLVVERFEKFEHDSETYQAGLCRRYPLKESIDLAVQSHDVEALNRAAAAAQMSPGAAKGLVLLKAYFQLDQPDQALHYLENLPRSSGHRAHAYKLWLSYLAEKKDYVAYENVWQQASSWRLHTTCDMWCQRLDLLFQRGQPLVALRLFRSLFRPHPKNSPPKGVGTHRLRISEMRIDIFHLMIESLIEAESPTSSNMAKAVEVYQLLQKQQKLKPTEETYMLFIRDALRQGDRMSAISWYTRGYHRGVTFSPRNIAGLLEFDVSNQSRKEQFSRLDLSRDVLGCLEVITRVIHFGQSRLDSRLSPQGHLSQSPSMLSTVANMPWVDQVQDEPADSPAGQVQRLYSGVLDHLAQHFAKQRPSPEKVARLRLLLLLWDHCTIIAGVPPSQAMERTLNEALHALHEELREKILRGAMFHNYNAEDPSSFHCYRFLRRIGSRWFVERLQQLCPSPISPDAANQLMEKLVWNGYDGVTVGSLRLAGVEPEAGGQAILDQVAEWKRFAALKREQALLERQQSRRNRKQARRSRRTAARYRNTTNVHVHRPDASTV